MVNFSHGAHGAHGEFSNHPSSLAFASASALPTIYRQAKEQSSPV